MNMNTTHRYLAATMTLLAFSLTCLHSASAQTFSSGSTGADGALTWTNGTLNRTVRAGGVYHYTTVDIGANGTVNFQRGADNSPIVILATGDVTINGTVNVSGKFTPYLGSGSAGGESGPGGFRGGWQRVGSSSTYTFLPTAGEGPGGGAPRNGNTGFGATYGAPTDFVTLIPLFGGSGGGGSGGSGGGGGGAILIASSTKITINGRIWANGGNGATSGGCSGYAGAGSGGAIRLVAPIIVGNSASQLQAIGSGTSSCPASLSGKGRIRLEALNLSGFFGQTDPVPSVANAPGPVFATSTPELLNVPTLAISSIGGQSVPSTPAGSYAVPDLALAPGTANPIPVVVNAANTPVGAPTQITVRVTPRSPGTATSVPVPTTGHSGTFASSSASVNVTLPVGEVSLLQAFASMTLTGQVAGLFPDIDGEPIQHVVVAAAPGMPSTMNLVTQSGRTVKLDDLPPEQQTQVARAWQVMNATRPQ